VKEAPWRHWRGPRTMRSFLFTARSARSPTIVAYRGSGSAADDLVEVHVRSCASSRFSVADQFLGGSGQAYPCFAGERLATFPDVPPPWEAGSL